MGLDQYMYTAQRAGQRSDFYDGASWDNDAQDFVNPDVEKPVEIAYRRKHPSLHGWFHNLWESKGNEGDFNGDELELTMIDLDILQLAVETATLPPTSGFFFGNGADEHYRGSDLEFITKAREAINSGLRVFYNSSW
jgi:hypothetical protein